MTVPTVVMMPKKKKSAARATGRNESVGTIQRDLGDAKAAIENVATPQAEAKDRVEGEEALLDALARNRWNRRRKLLPNLRLRYPTDDEIQHITKLAKVDHGLYGTINGIILDAHLADASYRTLSIPRVKEALNNVASRASQLGELLSKLDIGRGSTGSLDRAGKLLELELFVLQQTRARRILLPKYIDLLEGLSSAARRAARKPMRLPKGAGAIRPLTVLLRTF